ncbi:MAG: poly-gamma-glutamate synthase PgsB [Candidatus Cloacimonetes bacterium]|nr:poly-gamma-glutamate synthase PgsB [Candidatus Cloacimonadota bacterium]MCF7813671.1 poly-gamma-glutamate synthase PgsB [Candidatus Cloacimonadota bacterium]MCF7867173.1 poly-gamma-glutamate synthase PgsB [Candidatus Cloacimonadota bacterium]MCF7882507.1 poly-gamma-glutamate synthase PgsB [Candidatus Cloacimonadota bacterium]
MLGLIIGLLLLIAFGSFEYYRNKYYRKMIPTIIHVNGTRGKSSVTRLIAAGLRAGEKHVMAKTTGSAPVFIFENGSETPITRHFGANIAEQPKIIRFAARRKAEILVMECMAVTPEYQWVTEHKIINSDICVITNSRPDHLDVMGPGIRNVTLSLCNTLPPNGKGYTAERKMFPLMKKQADKTKTTLLQTDDSTVSDDEMRDFNHVEHKENVALALKVCEDLGVERKKALKKMYEAIPDVGATEVFHRKVDGKTVYFSHSFAANDPESTEVLVKHIIELYSNIKSVGIVLSTRQDRMFRSKQLIEMLDKIDYSKLFLIGQQTASVFAYGQKNNIPAKKMEDCGWVSGDDLMKHVKKLPDKEILLIGIGNIHGNGGIIVDYFKERKK